MARGEKSKRSSTGRYRIYSRQHREEWIINTPWGLLRLKSHECVYEPSDDTDLIINALWTLRDYIRQNVREAVDVGTGCGVLAFILRRMLNIPKVIALDISPYAIALARENLPEDVLLIACDSGSCLSDRSVDLAVVNPPYLPPENPAKDEPCNGWLHKAWSAEDMERICRGVARIARHMVVTVYSTLSPLDLRECLEEEGFSTHVHSIMESFFERLIVLVGWREV